MSIKLRLILWLSAVVVVFCLGLNLVLDAAVRPSFVELELEEADQDVDRVVQVIEAEIDQLALLSQDWGVWDDCYRFVEGNNQGFPEANVYESIHDSLDMVLLQITDLEGRVLLDSRVAPQGLEAVELAAFPRDHLTPGTPLRRTVETPEACQGLLNSEWGLLMFAAQPVLLNDHVGPVLGTLIMARPLDAKHIARYREDTHVEFELRAPEPSVAASARLGAVSESGALHASPAEFRELDAEVLEGRSTLFDMNGQPARTLVARIPRAITARGSDAIRSAWLSALASGVLLLLALYVMLERAVVGPLSRFTKGALAVRPRSEIVAGLELGRSDEIGMLSRRFAQLLEDIEGAQAQLTESAHRAGMSEVATNVLHNVGNMLNGVVVSSSVLRERALKLPSSDLSQVSAIVTEKGPGLGAWIEREPGGRALPRVLVALSQRVAEDQVKLLDECKELEQSVGQVRDLIRSQQDLAGGAGFVEEIELAAQIERALVLVQPGAHGVQVERKFEDLPPILTQRHKLLHVLVNLLKNATEAFDGLDRADKRITVALENLGSRVRITVTDNAKGIEPALLRRIFQHGFTTKLNGHGFGLHSAGNAAREMHGSLRAESKGPGTGTSFVLELPCRAQSPTSGSASAMAGEAVLAPLPGGREPARSGS